MQKAEVKAIAARKSKAGDRAIVISIVVEDEDRWVSEWIGLTAPEYILDMWSDALGTDPVRAVSEGNPWQVIGTQVLVELKDSDFGKKVEKVTAVTAADAVVEEPPPSVELPAKKEEEDDVPF